MSNSSNNIVLSGKYELLEMTAEGGMSYIYRARCVKTGNIVAAKILKPEYIGNKLYQEAFKKEAFHSMRLKHNNIVRTLDIGSDGSYRYMIMEYVDGIPLSDLIGGDRTISLKTSVSIAIKICEGLEYAHHKGIIHKDLKPSNIMIKRGMEPVIMDFGIAEDITRGETEDSKEVLGSVQYFSPEQAKGEHVDVRTDIYSLGVMLYEMATGTKPFAAADDVSLALMHLHQEPEPPRKINGEIPESLNKIILKSMAKLPDNRYKNVSNLCRDLKKCLNNPDGKYVLMYTENNNERIKKHTNQRRKTIVAVILGVVLLLMITMFSLIFRLSSSISEIPAESNLMPTFVDKRISEVKKVCRKMGLTLDVKYESDPSVDINKVISQSPEAGSVLEKNETVHVTVSSDSTSQEMPDLMGMTREQVLKKISDMGLKTPMFLEDVTAFTENAGAVDQYPKAGASVSAMTDIKVTFSKAVASPVVGNAIDYTDKNLVDAVAEASKDGYDKILIISTISGAEPGTVLSQSPVAGDMINADETIRFTIEPLGENYYTGVFAPEDAWFSSEQQVIMVTVTRKVNDIDCELIAFEQEISSEQQFIEKYGAQIQFGMFLSAADDEISAELTVYSNNEIIDRKIIVLEKENG